MPIMYALVAGLNIWGAFVAYNNKSYLLMTANIFFALLNTVGVFGLL